MNGDIFPTYPMSGGQGFSGVEDDSKNLSTLAPAALRLISDYSFVPLDDKYISPGPSADAYFLLSSLSSIVPPHLAGPLPIADLPLAADRPASLDLRWVRLLLSMPVILRTSYPW